MRRIRLNFDGLAITATLRETPTADAVWDALPLDSRVNTWGDEVYFAVPVSASPEADARSVVEVGEVAYWLAGSCIAICFGPTPVSTGDEIRLASDANIFGQVIGDAGVLRAVASGARVRVSRADVPGMPEPPPITLRGV